MKEMNVFFIGIKFRGWNEKGIYFPNATVQITGTLKKMSQNKDFILGLTNFNPSIFDAILVILIFCDGIANSCLCVN